MRTRVTIQERRAKADSRIWKLQHGVILCGSFPETTQLWASQGFDLAFADPPYNVGRTTQGWNDALDEPEYEEMVRTWVAEMTRLTRSVAVFLPDERVPLFARAFPGTTWRREVLNPSLNRERDYALVGWNCSPPAACPYITLETLGHETGQHPAETPATLVRWVIKELSAPGSSILDPFGGVGTTAVEAQQFGRRYCLIEKSSDFCAIALNRLGGRLR